MGMRRGGGCGGGLEDLRNGLRIRGRIQCSALNLPFHDGGDGGGGGLMMKWRACHCHLHSLEFRGHRTRSTRRQKIHLNCQNWVAEKQSNKTMNYSLFFY